ncbi:hypothetical protein B0H14DRAFT_3560880 [Mycena olivaceomarginata]|nr:hypothetical protein B0H14DRAFT_3560880 [Mycena olivaceomarginata]
MFPDSSLPMFRLPTSSPTRPDKCSLSTRTPTKRQILEEDSILSSPSTTRIAITSHESPGISLPMKRHFRLPTDSATTPPGIRTFEIADVLIVTASESTPPTSASQRRSTDFSDSHVIVFVTHRLSLLNQFTPALWNSLRSLESGGDGISQSYARTGNAGQVRRNPLNPSKSKTESAARPNPPNNPEEHMRRASLKPGISRANFECFSKFGFNLYKMFVPDFLHEVELRPEPMGRNIPVSSKSSVWVQKNWEVCYGGPLSF